MTLGPAAKDPLDAWLRQQWAVEPSPFAVEVDGARIACLGWNLAASDLPGLVLVHGFRAHAHWWDHIAPSLTRQFRVAAFDMSGMGDSEHRPVYTRAQHGREIEAVSTACGFERPVVVAHSYGGIVALTAAKARPDSFRRLVVIDSALPPIDEPQRRVPESKPRLYPSRAAARARFRLAPPGKWPVRAVYDYIADHSMHETAQGWSWKFDPETMPSLNADRASFAELQDVRTPADFIYGADSEIMTPPRLAALPAIMPTVARAVVIPQCHHHVMIEQPLALVAALRALLASETGASAPD